MHAQRTAAKEARLAQNNVHETTHVTASGAAFTLNS